MNIKTIQLLIIVMVVAFFAGCATTPPPKELVNAREAYQRASNGPAAQAAPAELHIANQALEKAELSFKDDPKSYKTLDLAYVAQRKAELAQAKAALLNEQKIQAQAAKDYQAKQGEIVAQTKEDLSQKKTELAASEVQLRELENTKIPFIMSLNQQAGGIEYENINFDSKWGITRTCGFDFSSN